MKRKHKTYSKPKRPFDKVRIDEEAKIKKEFGLKNKKEIWKAEAKIKTMREKAKKLIKAPEEDQKKLFEQLQKIGLKVGSIGDVLALDKKDILERRLQTIVTRKGLATTTKSARQLIVHKKILVEGRIIDKPSYIVPVNLEDKITVKENKKAEIKKKENVEEIPEEDKAEAEKAEEKTQEDVKEYQAEAEGK